jgi:hypothetical protein
VLKVREKRVSRVGGIGRGHGVVEWEVDVDRVVPDARAFRLAILDEFDQMEFLQLREVAVDRPDVAVDEPSGLADARGGVLDDRPEQLEVVGARDPVDVLRDVVDDSMWGSGVSPRSITASASSRPSWSLRW